MADPNAVELGDLVRDDLTGLEGIAYGITLWLHGCRRITIQPKAVKDGKPVEAFGVDEPQVTVLQRGAMLATSTERFKAPYAAERVTGGPMPEPSRQSDPTR